MKFPMKIQRMTYAKILLTFSTSSTCCSTVLNLWMIPKPPHLAISIAIPDSVTVSIGDEMNGILSGTFLENLELRFIWPLEFMEEYWGISKTSSNVNPKGIIFSLWYKCERYDSASFSFGALAKLYFFVSTFREDFSTLNWILSTFSSKLNEIFFSDMVGNYGESDRITLGTLTYTIVILVWQEHIKITNFFFIF